MREERIAVGAQELVIMRPDDPESLIDETRFGQDEFLPYWAELWPSGVALAEHVAGLDLRTMSVLELGCGLALPSLAAALGGADVLATDWAAEAVELAAANAAANGVRLATGVLAWEDESAHLLGSYDLVLAADVLYEARNAEPLLRLLDAALAPAATALIADPGRRHATAFIAAARARGWAIEQIAVEGLPAGGIARLRRGEIRMADPG